MTAMLPSFSTRMSPSYPALGRPRPDRTGEAAREPRKVGAAATDRRRETTIFMRVFNFSSWPTSMSAATFLPNSRSISSRAFSLMARSRKVGLKILPTAVTGKRSRTTTRLGFAGGSMMLRSRCCSRAPRLIACPRRRDNEQDRHLSGILIRHANSRTDLYARKIVGDVFDRRRIDIVSAAHDQILGAPCQNQPLFLGEVADVPGHQPAIVGQDVDVVLRIDVTRKNLRPANHDQAAREFGTLLHLLRTLQGDDLDHCVRRPKADASRERFAPTGIEGDRGCRLGHAIRFKQLDTGPLLKPLADSLRQDRAAGERHAHRRDISVSDGNFGKRGDRRGHPAHDRHPITLYDASNSSE